MPEKKSYYVTVPGEKEGYSVDATQFEAKQDEFFKQYPTAQVSEFSPYTFGKTDIHPGDYMTISVPGEDPYTIDATQFSDRAEEFIKKYPKATIARMRPVGAWGDEIRKNISHADYIGNATGNAALDANLYGAGSEALNGKRTRMQDLQQQVQEYNRNMQAELDAIPGQWDKLRRKRELNKGLKDLETQLKAATEEYYSDGNMVNVNFRRAQNAQMGNEELDKVYAPFKEEADKRREEREGNVGIHTVPFGFGAYADQPSYEDQLYTAAKDLNDDTIRLYNAPSKYGKESGFNNFMKGAADRASQVDFWTMGLTGIADQLQLKGVFDKISQAGGMKEVNEDTVNEILSPMEQQLLIAFFRNADAQAERAQDMSRGYQSGQTATDSLQFMAQFALSGGLTAGATKALSNGAVKSFSELIGKWIGKGATKGITKALAKGAGAVAESGLNMMFQPGTMKSILEQQNQLDENGDIVDQKKAAWRGIGDYLIENISERSGEIFNKVLGAPIKAIGGSQFGAKIAATPFAKWGKAFYDSGSMKLLRAGGFNGYFGEIFEEYFGDALRTVSGVDPEALKNSMTWDNLLVMATSFAPMAVFGGGANMARYGMAKNDYARYSGRLEDTMRDLNFSNDQIAHAMDMGRLASPEEVGKEFGPVIAEMANRGATKSEMADAWNYAMSGAQLNLFEGFEAEKRNEQRTNTLNELQQSFGDFWRDGEEGVRDVTLLTLPDGTGGYVKNIDEGSGELIYISAQDGSIHYTNATLDGVQTSTEGLDQYLDRVILAKREADENAAVQQEAQAARKEFERGLQSGWAVDVGTVESPVAANVAYQVDENGDFIQDSMGNRVPMRDADGNYVLETGEGYVPISEEDLAKKWGLNINPKSLDQVEADEVAEYTAARDRMDTFNRIPQGTEIEATLEGLDAPVMYNFTRAVYNEDDKSVHVFVEDQETGEEVELPEEAFPNLQQAAAREEQAKEELQAEENAEAQPENVEQQIESDESETPRDFRGNPLPMTSEGQVDETALWNRDPEAWAVWNDQQQNDGGADSMAYIQAAAKKAQGDLKKLQSAYAKELDFNNRKTIKEGMAPLNERIKMLNDVLEGYKSRAEADAKAAEEAAKAEAEAESSAPVQEAENASGMAAMQQPAPGITAADVAEIYNNAENTKEQDKGKPGRKEILEALYQANPNLVQHRNEQDLANAIEDVVNLAKQHPELAISKEILGRAAQAEAQPDAQPEPEQQLTTEQKEEERRVPIRARAQEWAAKTGQNVVLLESKEEVPSKTAREAIEDGQPVKGWYDRKSDKVYIYVPNIESLTDLDQTYIHEVISHKGLRDMLGPFYEKLLANVWNDVMDDAAKAKFTAYVKLTNPDAEGDTLMLAAADEYIANLSENADLESNQTAWNKFIWQVWNFLAQLMGGNIHVTENDLNQLLKASMSRYREIAEKGDAAKIMLRLNTDGVASNGEEVRFSVKYSPKTEEEAKQMASDIAKDTGVSQKKALDWVKSETSLAAVIGQKENQPYLEYTADDRFDAIKMNSDYPQGTVDFNNICRKRLAFTDMYQRIQKAFPNVIITGEDLAQIRNIMKSHGLTVACGLCYVEDRRQLLGEIAKDFIDNYATGFAEYAARGGEAKKKNAKKFLDLIGEDRKDDLSIYDLITLAGSSKLYQEHPGIYNAFQAFNNARGQQSGNLFQGYAEYKREILKWSKKKVQSVNDNGGLRIFSYSDFEAHHLIDLVQVIQDCARKGVKIQGYTKVPAFARAIANTGVKLNRSLIPLGDTGIVDGKLAYDPIEGIDINDPNFLESNDNVGNILIGINDEQIRLAMADPFVHYIIPYHSNQKEVLRSLKQTGAWTNYKYSQNEKDASGKTTLVNIYTEVLAAAEEEGKPIRNEKQFTEKFLEVCKAKGLTPRFEQFLDKDADGNYVYTPGYYKLLLDFKMFDEKGRYLPQKPVVAEFDDAFNKQILDEYVAGEKEKYDGDLDDVYNEIVSELGLDDRVKTGQEVLNDILAAIGKKAEEKPEEKVSFRISNEELFDKAKERFGTTKDLREAGYILPDGTLLDFSGRHQVSGDSSYLSGSRHVDHRDIADLNYERDINTPSGIETDMVDFINRGAVRIDGDSGSINLAVKPTDAQMSVIRRIVERTRGEAYIDFGADNTDHYAEYDGARPERIVNDIKRYFDEGYKPEGNIMFRITPEQDKEYLDAVEAGDMEKAGKMVEDAARAAGYDSPKLYHGTDAFGFTKIDTSASDDGMSFWATNKEEAAGSYTKLAVTRKPGAEISNEEYEKAIEVADNALDDEIRNFRSLIDKYFSEWYFGQQGNEGIRKVIMDANHVPGYGDGVYDVLAEFVVEAYGDYGEDYEEEYEDFADWEENSPEAQKIFESISSLEGLRNQLWEIENGNLTGGIYELYANTDNMFVVDADGKAWNELHPEGLPKIERGQYKNVPYRTRDVVKWAQENGYDGVIFKNIKDNGQYGRTEASDVYAFLNPQAQVKSADPVTYDDEGNVIPLSQRFNPQSSDIRFRVVTDPAKIEELEAGEQETGYRNVVMNEDGTLGSPMAGKLGKKGAKSVKTSSFAFDQWEEAEENPDMATEDGKINLIKPGGKGNVDGVDYNPYIHIRPNTVNRQFTQAWKRPELVFVETAYPKSELTSGYKADKAKLSVGRHDWNGGELILSRYDKPLRVVPWEEVADAWQDEFKNGVTFDIVPPALLPILNERGVEILAPKKAAGEAAMDAYKEWRKENPTEAQKKAIEFVTGKKDEGWKKSADIIAEQEKKAKEIKQLLADRGYEKVFINRSDTKAGHSTYVKVNDDNWLPIAKIRISDHSVTNFGRLMDEYHVGKDQSAEDVVNDLLGKKEAKTAAENIAEANAQQKLPVREEIDTEMARIEEPDIMFRLSNNNRATIESWLKKRKDISDVQRAAVVDYIDGLEDSKLQLATGRWYANGAIRLPEDMDKVKQAVSVAGKAKVDPLQYDTPMALLDAHANFKPTAERINPDNVNTLHRAAEYPEGVVVYDVDESEESRKNMRKIINTHYGEDASPWCLLQGDGKGNLTKDSKKYWNHYNADPKQVAFKDGKLLAFSADDTGIKVWWDRQDTKHYGIPITKKIDGDELGRSVAHILQYESVVRKDALERDLAHKYNCPPYRLRELASPEDIAKLDELNKEIAAQREAGVLEFLPEGGAHPFKGNRQNGVYEEWSADGETLLERTHYKDGKEDGITETWFPNNGQQEKRAEMKDDNYAGDVEYWFDNGKQRLKVHFNEDGKRDGESIHWWRNGNKREEGNYKNGERVGEHYEYSESGELRRVARYDENGETTGFDEYRPSGLIERTTYTKDGAVKELLSARVEQPVMFRIANANQDIFISNAENALGKIKMEKATPEQWKKMLEKEGGLKAGEDKWLGLSEWLDSSDRKTLTKDEVAAFIGENKIKIEETHYADEVEEDYADAIKSYQDEYKSFFNEKYDEIEKERGAEDAAASIGECAEYAWDQMKEQYGDDFELAFNEDGDTITPTFDYGDDLTDAAQFFLDQRRSTAGERINPTRKRYTTEGLDNLHEIALTVPTIEPWNESDKVHFGDAGEGRAISWARFGDTTVSSEQDAAEAKFREAEQAAKEYKQEVVNKYALQATGSKTTMDLATPEETAKVRELQKEAQRLYTEWKYGRHAKDKVLVIDEIQSKRHQEAREKGYSNVKNIQELEEKWQEASKAYDDYIESLKAKYGGFNGMAGNVTEEENKKALELNDASVAAAKSVDDAKVGIPDAPFEKNWPELTMKRMLRYAAEGGYKYMAWTTGEQQADRYNMESAIGKIYASRDGEKYYVEVYDPAGNEITFNGLIGDSRSTGSYTQEELVNIFGKEGAKEIITAVDALPSEEEAETLRKKAEETRAKEDRDAWRDARQATIDGSELFKGEGMKGFYDEILPRWMNKYAKQWGVKVEDIKLPWLTGEDGKMGITMHSVPITDEMRDSVMEGQLMFRIADRKEDEDSLEFVQRVVKELPYKPIVNVVSVKGKEDGPDGNYDPETKTITIFAKKDTSSSEDVEDTYFHENFHAAIDRETPEAGDGFYADMIAVGREFTTPEEYDRLKDFIRKKYEEGEWSKEMSAQLFASMLRSGGVVEAMPLFLEGNRNILDKIINDLKYDAEAEAIRRAEEDVETPLSSDGLRGGKAEGAAEGREEVVISDLLERFDNQDGEQYPWMSNGELIDQVERNVERDDATDRLFELIDRYHKLEEENFAEGKRDFAGGEMEELFEEILDELRSLEPVETEEAETRFKIGEPIVEHGPTAEELITKVQNSGLPGILEKDDVDDYFKNAFMLMPEGDRKAAAQNAIDKDLNFRRPVRDYIASLASKGYANDETGFLRAMANRLEQLISTDQPLNENQLLYMMWRDAKRYAKQDVLSLAQDIALRKKLGIGEFVNQFPGEAETIERKAEENVDRTDEKRSAERKEALKEAKKTPLAAINRAMGAQRQYDRTTVDEVVALAKQMIKEGNISEVNAREMGRLMTIIKATNGRRPETVKNCCKQLVDFMVDHTLQEEEDLLNKMLKVKTAKVKEPGVDVQAKLDIRAQGIINTFREYMGRDEESISDAINERFDKVSDEKTSETRKEELQAELDGLNLALQYCTEIVKNEADNTAIRDGMKTAKAEFNGLTDEEKKRYAKMFKEETEASYDMIRKNKIDRVNAYRELRAALGAAIAEGAERAKTFLEKERERVAQIHHEANSDMQGVDDNPIEPKVKGIGKLINNGVARLLTSPLATFDQMLRLLGRKHPNGQGYLWNRYMGQLRDANDNEKIGLDKANDELNAKVQEVFGDKTMTWNDLYNLEKGMGKATIRFFNANGKWVEEELSAGNLLYIYMVDKMPDGRMKLRQMGIDEDDVRAIRDNLDPRFLQLADWIQEEFLTKLRDKYNQVHQRLFGTSMAAIDNYFPLRILGGVIREEIDLSNPDSNVLPSAMTGSIIKRTVNRKQLDITGTDAFSLVIEHIQEMEHWAAFAELNRDLGTLLSYKRFQNQMKHLTTIYGAGKELWGRFKKTAILAAHEYRPARTPLDTAAINLAKGVSTAKISFRAYTALKQILSWPAFLADANIVQLAKYTAPWNWRSNWKWAMENLPNFKKRVESRTVGNEKLDPDELDSKFWGTDFAKWIGRNGMSMNAFVDALTVSIGSRSMYETKKAQYLAEGYDEARADKKARFDATTLFNETQQSSEKEFMSTMQADRTVVSVALSVYRNASFGYQRQLHSALRTLGRLAKKGYKEQSLEFMTKQLVRDGLSEEQARSAAEKRYNKALGQALVRAAVFGFLVEFAWNLGANAVYLLFGDDPDEKKAMLEEDAIKALSGGMVEGLAGGSIISDLLSKFEQGESIYGYDMNTLPIMQDVKNTIGHFSTDPVAAANELVFLGVQIGLGTNPQTFSDAIVAIIDACDGNMETAKEVELLIMRILQVPQSQIDELMIDEIGMTAADAKKLSYEEVAKRYVDYKMMRNAPVTGFAYSDELRQKREKSLKTSFKKKYNKRQQLKEESK